MQWELVFKKNICDKKYKYKKLIKTHLSNLILRNFTTNLQQYELKTNWKLKLKMKSLLRLK